MARWLRLSVLLHVAVVLATILTVERGGGFGEAMIVVRISIDQAASLPSLDDPDPETPPEPPPEPVVEPRLEPVPPPDIVAKAEPVPARRPEPVVEPESVPEPTPPEAATEPEKMPKPEPTPEAVAEPEPESEPASPPETVAEPEPAPMPEAVAELEPVPAPAPRTVAKPKPESAAKPKVAPPRPKPKPKPPSRASAPKKSQSRPPQVASLPRSDGSQRGDGRRVAGILDEYIVKYRRRLKQLTKKYTDRHPDVLSTRRILAQLQTAAVPLTENNRRRIRRQVASCWSRAPGGSGGPVVELEIALDPEGRVVTIRDLDPDRAAKDVEYGGTSKAAMRAVRRCSPLWLPLSAFQSWRSLVLRLDPSEGQRR